MNKINIPKEVFEQIFMKEGGEKDLNKVLAGGVQYGLDKEKPIATPNTEVEDGEWILDSQGLRVVEGEDHEEGGTDVVLEHGARVLSNFTKIPTKVAKDLNKEYKVKIKNSETYAQALEKVYKSLGLNSIQDKQKKFIDKIEKQQKETEDETTYKANLQAISADLNALEEKKKPLLEIAIEVFQTLYSDQESRKPEEELEIEKPIMQEGGSYGTRLDGTNKTSGFLGELKLKNGQVMTENSIGVNFNGEEVQIPTVVPTLNQEEIDWLKNGNNVLDKSKVGEGIIQKAVDFAKDRKVKGLPYFNEEIKMQEGGEFKYRRTNKFENPEYYTHQNESFPSNFGGVSKSDTRQEYGTLFPQTTQTFFGDSIIPQEPGKFQQELYKNYYPAVTSFAEELYGKESDKYKQYANSVGRTNFTNDQLVSGLDSKYGNYTSTRSPYAFPIVPQDVYDKMQAEGINTFGQLKGKYPELYKQYIPDSTNVREDFWLAPIEEDKKKEQEVIATAQNEVAKVNNPEVQDLSKRMGVFPMPDQSPMPPEAMMAHLKTNRRYERADYVEVNPEQQLIELERNMQRASNDLGFMPANQRAAVSASLLATGTDTSNKILDQASQMNRQEFNRIQNANNQIQMAEENAGASDALNYEQRQFSAQARTADDIRKYFNTLQRNQVRNFNYIESKNLNNALSDNFQITDRGIEAKGPAYTFEANNVETKSEEQLLAEAKELIRRSEKNKKSKKRFGGTI